MSKIKAMTPGIPHSARMRAYFVGVLVTAGLTGVAWKAYALQVDDGEHYRELAERQHGSSVNIPAPRGDVIDAKGRPLAVSADADSIWANPREIHDVTDVADKLGKVMGQDPGALESKLAGDKKFVWLARHVPSDIADAVRKAKLPGIVVEKEPRRWYPARSIGGPIVGRADIDSRGLEGIELSMDAMLKGTRGAGHAVRVRALTLRSRGESVTVAMHRRPLETLPTARPRAAAPRSWREAIMVTVSSAAASWSNQLSGEC